MLHRKIRVNDGFAVSKVVASALDEKEEKNAGKRQKIRRFGIVRGLSDLGCNRVNRLGLRPIDLGWVRF